MWSVQPERILEGLAISALMESEWPVSRGKCDLSGYACYTPPCNYKCLQSHQQLHHLMREGQKTSGYSPVCHFRRSRDCTFPSGWGKKQMKQVFRAAKTPPGWIFFPFRFVFFMKPRTDMRPEIRWKWWQNMQPPANSYRRFWNADSLFILLPLGVAAWECVQHLMFLLSKRVFVRLVWPNEHTNYELNAENPRNDDEWQTYSRSFQYLTAMLTNYLHGKNVNLPQLIRNVLQKSGHFPYVSCYHCFYRALFSGPSHCFQHNLLQHW